MVADETSYVEGARAVWRQILQQAMRELGRDAPEWNVARLLAEREEAVSKLRQVCAAHGDNDWPEELHLGDVIEKHLWRHL